MDFVNLVKKGKKMAQKVENRPAFMEGIPKELSRAAEVVNEPFLRKSELPSANFHSSAKSLAKLGAKYLREKYISFAQFVSFLREVHLLFNF